LNGLDAVTARMFRRSNRNANTRGLPEGSQDSGRLLISIGPAFLMSISGATSRLDSPRELE
jgi:hypothetical protein